MTEQLDCLRVREQQRRRVLIVWGLWLFFANSVRPCSAQDVPLRHLLDGAEPRHVALHDREEVVGSGVSYEGLVAVVCDDQLVKPNFRATLRVADHQAPRRGQTREPEVVSACVEVHKAGSARHSVSVSVRGEER